MPVYNFSAMQSAMTRTRFDSSQDLPTWLQLAYEQVWNAAEWSFKKVEATAMVLPTSGLPTMPDDFSKVDDLYDDHGDSLQFLEESEFRSVYLDPRVASQKGRPESFTVINRQIILGPYPDAAYSGYCAYTRRLCTRTSTGVAQVGNFQAGTDLPFWSPTEGEHHYVVPLRAMVIGRNFQSDLSAQLVLQEYQSALAAMIEEFGVDYVATREYGADDL